jgi:hypothetical protein
VVNTIGTELPMPADRLAFCNGSEPAVVNVKVKFCEGTEEGESVENNAADATDPKVPTNNGWNADGRA